MARLTVEDCLKKEPNRFKLIMKAAKRARELEKGAPAKVAWDNDKPTVAALREIAEGVIDKEPEKEAAEEVAPVEEVEITTEEVSIE
jgi:DNA-directed RNA polymerase subunit omega